MSIISDYLDPVAPAERAALEHVCAVAHELIPGLKEVTSYGLPTLAYDGRSLVGFAAGKKFLSIYPFSGSVVTQVRDRLGDHTYTTGAIHFTAEKPLTDEILRAVILARKAEIDERNAA